MINPINNYQQNEYQPGTRQAPKVSGDQQFSLDASPEQSEEKGVVYEPSRASQEASDRSSSSSQQKDTFESTLDQASRQRKKQAEGPDPTAFTMNVIWEELTGLFTGIWKAIKRIANNLWTSKPLNEGAQPLIQRETEEESTQNVAAEASPASADSNILDTPESSLVKPDDVDLQESASLGIQDSSAEKASAEYDSLEAFEAARDKDIKKALADGDRDRFRSLISDNGNRKPVRFTSMITTYDARGKIVHMDPSDENKILHGDHGAKKL